MFQGHKLITLLISLIGAVVLWIYVVTQIKPQTDFPVSSIPISINDRALEERGLLAKRVVVERGELCKFRFDVIVFEL